MRFFGHRGFTTLEILVVLSILGILMGLSVSAYTTFINNASADSAANDFVNAVKDARSRAISVEKPEDLFVGSGGESVGWLFGYGVLVADNTYATYAVYDDTSSRGSKGIFVDWNDGSPKDGALLVDIQASERSRIDGDTDDSSGASIIDLSSSGGANYCQFIFFESVNGSAHFYKRQPITNSIANGSLIELPDTDSLCEVGFEITDVVKASIDISKLEFEVVQ